MLGLPVPQWTTEMVHVGEQIALTDLAPVDMWPPEWDDLVDLKRGFACHNPRVIGSASSIDRYQGRMS
jgi:hypothetical protein